MSRSPHRSAGFSLVEASISTLIVALMFAASMAAVGVSARERRSRAESRLGEALALRLMSEIMLRRFEFPAGTGIGRAAGVSSSERSRWLDVDDYFDLKESPPKDRLGRDIPGAAGWRWASRVEYASVPASTTVAASTTASTGSLLSVSLLGVSLNVGGAPPATAATPLKRITVIVTSPSKRVTTLTALRSAYSGVDRVAMTSFTPYAAIDLTFGPQSQPASVGVGLLNTPVR